MKRNVSTAVAVNLRRCPLVNALRTALAVPSSALCEQGASAINESFKGRAFTEDAADNFLRNCLPKE